MYSNHFVIMSVCGKQLDSVQPLLVQYNIAEPIILFLCFPKHTLQINASSLALLALLYTTSALRAFPSLSREMAEDLFRKINPSIVSTLVIKDVIYCGVPGSPCLRECSLFTWGGARKLELGRGKLNTPLRGTKITNPPFFTDNTLIQLIVQFCAFMDFSRPPHVNNEHSLSKNRSNMGPYFSFKFTY